MRLTQMIVRTGAGSTRNGDWLLLPAVVKLVALRRPVVLAALVAINLACLAMNLLHTGSFPFIWVSPAILLLYIVATREVSAVPVRSAVAV